MALDPVSILLDMDMVMVIMLDSATLLLAMVMVMVLDIPGTMESVKPRLSQRLMLSMEPTDMVMDLDTVPTPLDMADTLAMDMADALYGAYGYGYGLGHRTYSL